MSRFSEDEMQEIKVYLIDFIDSFDPKELAQAIREDIITIEEIEDAFRRKMSI